jgi:hypothetical protein
MSRSIRYGLLFAAIALIAVSALYASGSTQAASPSVAVQGQTLQLFQNGSKTFTTIDANTVDGTSYPVSIICAGNVDVPATYGGAAPFTVPAIACLSPTATDSGMRGWVVTQEHVVRSYANAANPTFVMTATLGFTGQVYLNNKSYYGTMLLKMSATGQLNNTPTITGTTCLLSPNDQGCTAKNFTGTWEVVPSQGGGELRAVQGGGPIGWAGFPNAPVYSGTMSLAYDSFLPLSFQAK